MFNHQTAIWSGIKKYIQYYLEINFDIFSSEQITIFPILHADKFRNVFQFEPTINISNITPR